MPTWIYLIPLVVLAAMLMFAQRAKRKQLAAEIDRANRIDVGTEVMTTSGLYATVVARYDDGTVRLAIAPGVEVKWAIAALRDADSIPPEYRRAIDGADAPHPGNEHKPGS